MCFKSSRGGGGEINLYSYNFNRGISININLYKPLKAYNSISITKVLNVLKGFLRIKFT